MRFIADGREEAVPRKRDPDLSADLTTSSMATEWSPPSGGGALSGVWIAAVSYGDHLG